MFLLGLASGYTLNKPDKKCYPIGSLTTRSIMANPLKSMEFLKRKAEELRGKGARRVQGTHPVPGSRRRSDFSIAHFSVIIQCTTGIPCRTYLIFFILTELLKQS